MYGHPLDLNGLDREQSIQLINRTFHEMFAQLREGRVPLDHRER
jgi:hypothetical protein